MVPKAESLNFSAKKSFVLSAGDWQSWNLHTTSSVYDFSRTVWNEAIIARLFISNTPGSCQISIFREFPETATDDNIAVAAKAHVNKFIVYKLFQFLPVIEANANLLILPHSCKSKGKMTEFLVTLFSLTKDELCPSYTFTSIPNIRFLMASLLSKTCSTEPKSLVCPALRSLTTAICTA